MTGRLEECNCSALGCVCAARKVAEEQTAALAAALAERTDLFDLPRCEECGDEFMAEDQNDRYCGECLEAGALDHEEDVVEYMERRQREG